MALTPRLSYLTSHRLNIFTYFSQQKNMSDLILSQIYIYPIKSLRGIEVSNIQLTDKGPKWDRRWMLVDPDGMFFSQRELGNMALLQPKIEADQMRISDLRGEGEDLLFPLQLPAGAAKKKVTVWRDECEAFLVSAEADAWFSKALDTPCHLVYMPETSRRPVDPKYAVGPETVSFADGYPYLIIGQAALDDLNERLAEPIDMIRFRPNLVFSGGIPFMEDEWKHFSIGSARFRGTKPCARCQIPTIDLKTGKIAKEPTKTLATFRRQGNKILFGLNACWEPDNGKAERLLKVGDPINIRYDQFSFADSSYTEQ